MTNPYRDALVELVAAYDAHSQGAEDGRWPAAWEAARRAAALPVEPVRMLTQAEIQQAYVAEHGSSAHAADFRFAENLFRLDREVNAGKTIPKEAK